VPSRCYAWPTVTQAAKVRGLLTRLGQLARQRRPGNAAIAQIEPPKFKTVEDSHVGRLVGFAIAVLIAIVGGYWVFNSDASQSRRPNQPVAGSSASSAMVPTAPVDTSSKSNGRVTSSEGSPTRRRAEGDAPTDCCEWVSPSTRSDGTGVDGYWRSKAGCPEGCPLATKTIELTPSPKPPIHVGPRGGRYHYSKNGNKVYEHRK
jgi:hypothetical protein